MSHARISTAIGLLVTMVTPLYTPAVFAQCTDYAAMNPIVDQWNPLFRSGEFVIDGEFMYVLREESGLSVLNLSQSEPFETDWIPEIDFWACLKRDGRRLYAGSDRLCIIDIMEAASPTLLGSLELPEIRDLAPAGDLICVANGWQMFRVVNVADPAAPTIVGELQFPNRWVTCVAVAGSRAYVGVQDQGVFAVDISDPTSPRLIPSSFVACHPAQIFTLDGLVWISEVAGRLAAWDFGPAQGPAQRGRWDGADRCRHVAIGGGRAYVCSSAGLYVLDVRPDGSVKQTNLIPGLYSPQHVAIWGDRALVSQGDQIITVVDPDIVYTPPAPVFTLDDGQAHTYMQIANGYLYDVSDSHLRIAEVTLANSPRYVGSAGLPDGGYGDVEVVDGVAYVPLYRAGLAIFDVSDPRNPILASRTEPGFRPVDLAVRGHWVYVAAEGDDDEDGIVALIDARKPHAPRVVATVELSHKLTGIAVVGDNVLVVTEEGYLFTISSMLPSAVLPPRVLGQTDLFMNWGAYDIVVRGDIAFITGVRSLGMVDCANPEYPEVMDWWESVDIGFQLALDGDYLYVGSTGSGVRIFDISADRFDLAGQVPFAGFIFGIAAADGRLYVGGNEGPVLALPAQCASSRPEPAPTPVTPGLVDDLRFQVKSGLAPVAVRLNLASPQPGEVSVYDLRGRHVATLATGVLPAGEQSLTWNGRGDSGIANAAGVYVVRVVTGATTSSRSFALLH